MKRVKQQLARWRRCQDGIAMIEFAIVLPVMLTLAFGALEIIRYIIIVQKIERAAFAMTSIVVQYRPATSNTPPQGELTATELRNNIFPRLPQLLEPYSGTIGGTTGVQGAMFTSVNKEQISGNWVNVARWSLVAGNTGMPFGFPTQAQSVTNGQKALLTNRPQPCTVLPFDSAEIATKMAQTVPNENIIVGEVFFAYTPMITNILDIAGVRGLQPRIISRAVFLPPRNGDLLNLPGVTNFNNGPC